ncbi:MAG TPA: NAD(P)-binding protein [Mobilitalea sp.]|nr:NAD(P)-binding protein [Mobilitalea sp.]
MLRIAQIKLPIGHLQEAILAAAAKALRLSADKIESYSIVKKSLDARKKNDIRYIYTIDVKLLGTEEYEQDIVNKARNVNITISKQSKYEFLPTGKEPLDHPPVVVGTGPAGLYCAYLLAKNGYQPIVIERGYEVSRRVKEVEQFWKEDLLNPECNVQFGEGGAGTFSDGKLNTMVKDSTNRHPFVMETFEAYGAPSDILYLNKPHIGTDKLRTVVINMRKEILRMGGEVRFATKLTDLIIEDGKLLKIELNHKEILPCDALVTAIGHSARDTFSMFLERGLLLSPKAFAIGLRVEHKQSKISRSQYGDNYIHLPPADYKLAHQSSSGRGVYSFCMCPGGFVVNSSSEVGHLVVNGMSNYMRDEDNANSAIVVTVGPEDFKSSDPLSGIAFQRKWEESAYKKGKGKVPIQLFGDLLKDRESVTIGGITPLIRGAYQLTNLRGCLPEEVTDSIIEGISAFDRRIKGFADEEAVLSGIETRTSSPVRIHRNETLESNIKGIYPCGEGAGYAGGITSASIDGMKVYEALATKFHPIY